MAHDQGSKSAPISSPSHHDCPNVPNSQVSEIGGAGSPPGALMTPMPFLDGERRHAQEVLILC